MNKLFAIEHMGYAEDPFTPLACPHGFAVCRVRGYGCDHTRIQRGPLYSLSLEYIVM